MLIYGHYDVQPVDPLELWHNKPFDAKLVNGEFLGRGAADDKGGLLQPIQAVEALLKSEGKLPVNVKVQKSNEVLMHVSRRIRTLCSCYICQHLQLLVICLSKVSSISMKCTCTYVWLPKC